MMLPQRARHFVSVAAGETDVEEDGVKLVRQCDLETGVAVGCDHYRVTGLIEPFAQQLQHALFVFNDQNAHQCLHHCGDGTSGSGNRPQLNFSTDKSEIVQSQPNLRKISPDR